jgi:hypothetical protein
MSALTLVSSSSRSISPSGSSLSVNKDAEIEAWNLLDALDWRSQPTTEMPTPNLSIGDAILATSPDWLQSSTRRSSNADAPWEDMEIPNFPDLTITEDGHRTSGLLILLIAVTRELMIQNRYLKLRRRKNRICWIWSLEID